MTGAGDIKLNKKHPPNLRKFSVSEEIYRSFQYTENIFQYNDLRVMSEVEVGMKLKILTSNNKACDLLMNMVQTLPISHVAGTKSWTPLAVFSCLIMEPWQDI